MGATQQEEIQAFWKEREERFGGSIRYHSYATLIGEAGSGEVNGRGGLCYIIKETFHFEDFEKYSAMMALFNRKDKNYSKTEIALPLGQIQGLVKIPEKWGYTYVSEGLKDGPIPELKGMAAWFRRGLWLLHLRDRPSLIMDIMAPEELRSLLPSASELNP